LKIETPHSGIGFINIPGNEEKHSYTYCREKIFPVLIKLQPVVETYDQWYGYGKQDYPEVI
jgi:hypothetical protein